MINLTAFGQQYETNLVNKLRGNTTIWIPELSFVATSDNNDVAIGYILFTIGKIGDQASLVLAPLAVDLEHQKYGVGKALIEGIRKAAEMNFRSVNVLVRKDYYSKFGFEPASKYNITCPFDLGDPDVFQFMELTKNGLDGVSGKIEYAKEFLE